MKKDFENTIRSWIEKNPNYKKTRPYVDDMSVLIREEENGG